MSALGFKVNDKSLIDAYCFTARELGAMAYIEGKLPKDNPYCPLEIEHDDWLDGYIVEVELVSKNFDKCFGVSAGSA